MEHRLAHIEEAIAATQAVLAALGSDNPASLHVAERRMDAAQKTLQAEGVFDLSTLGVSPLRESFAARLRHLQELTQVCIATAQDQENVVGAAFQKLRATRAAAGAIHNQALLSDSRFNRDA